jgi:hypothetical protein
MDRVLALEKVLSETQSVVAVYRESKKKEEETGLKTQIHEEESLDESKSDNLSSPK